MRMDVRSIRWVGIHTSNYAALVGLFHDVLGLMIKFEEPTTVEFSTADGDQIQIMGPGDRKPVRARVRPS